MHRWGLFGSAGALLAAAGGVTIADPAAYAWVGILTALAAALIGAGIHAEGLRHRRDDDDPLP